jgi:hypothetical protein
VSGHMAAGILTSRDKSNQLFLIEVERVRMGA